MPIQYTLAELADKLSVEFQGDESHLVMATSSIDDAQASDISFFTDKKYQANLETTQAGVIIISQDNAALYAGNKLISANPYLTYAYVAQLLDSTPAIAQGISDKADIHPSAKVSPQAHIAAFAVIEENAVVSAGAFVGANSFIGKNAFIGEGTKVNPNVSIYHNVVVGAECLIHSGAVIGSDGFGFANNKGEWVKIPQVGKVVLEDSVEIGANTAIDRGALHDTIIRKGVKIDNLVHLAHNVEIDENSAIAANVAIAGSTKVGKRCTFAGCVAVNGHIEITDDVHFTGTSMVTQSIKDAGVYSSGMPAVTNKEWRKNTARLRKIEDLNAKVKLLEQQLKSLT
ncbi:UDP-3-O-(3-hydroxymyristoyl)glucosamine N-acyltransferase [Catenovulum maritimum]|uniref:UDP-3-O-acylglucosamine N-acyltransferase n=1 Tax=Catenovulum maritimum TaxID=1513271 RepID=A0A0J8GXG6_9ALTE|nr:UDP-3-O-(3-hydroxymyristoyl)glucosamine N-acyltransferase [Catenovulum maritimum]KMT65438.1 UDP-3-O-(3-hydroxymyristoyl) glucosamine N-acyltransferase [Catenovulum maritimum]